MKKSEVLRFLRKQVNRRPKKPVSTEIVDTLLQPWFEQGWLDIKDKRPAKNWRIIIAATLLTAIILFVLIRSVT